MDAVIKTAVSIIAAVLAMWLHEIPKYYLTLYLTRPAFRQEARIKDIWAKSVDPIGLILLVFMRVGWQMPLKIDAAKLVNKKNGLIAISVLGMLTSLLGAIMLLIADKYWLIALRSVEGYPYLSYFVITWAFYNVIIFVVNLLPVPPLDMTKIVYAVSPNAYFKILQNGRLLQSFFVLFIAFGGLRMISLPFFRAVYELIW